LTYFDCFFFRTLEFSVEVGSGKGWPNDATKIFYHPVQVRSFFSTDYFMSNAADWTGCVCYLLRLYYALGLQEELCTCSETDFNS
jgi:hypothetical protein